MVAAPEERRQLESLAYGRAATAEQRRDAVARLRALDDRRAATTLPLETATADGDDAGRPERVDVVRRRWIIIVAAAVVVAVAATIAVVTRPVDSLTVFDRDQTSSDRRAAEQLGGAPPETVASVRMLASGGQWSAFGYRDPLKRVCLGVVTAGALSLRCVPRAEFERTGVSITSDFLDSSSTERQGDFQWGPQGALHVDLRTTPVGSSPAPYPI